MATIPSFSQYSITESGEIKKIITGKVMTQQVNIDGYFVVSLTQSTGKYKIVRVHRLIAEVFIPNPDKLPIVDHINRNCQDNRIENLRWVTRSQNSQNHKIFKTNKSGISNVNWCKAKKRWRAHRMIEGTRIYLGYFVTKEEAEESIEKYLTTGETKTERLMTTNTLGEKNIILDKRRNTYRFERVINKIKYRSPEYKTIEEAIAYRDSLSMK